MEKKIKNARGKTHFLAGRYGAGAVLVVFAYLAFVNLDYAPFWEDEAIVPVIARNMLRLGAPLLFCIRTKLCSIWSRRTGSCLAMALRIGNIFTGRVHGCCPDHIHLTNRGRGYLEGV